MSIPEDLLHRTEDLLSELAADRAKAKAKEASEAWSKTAAVSIVMFAVLAAVAVQRQSTHSTRSLKHTSYAIFKQVTASNAWSYFQSKSTKGHLYGMSKELIDHLGPSRSDKAAQLAAMDEQLARYEIEKNDIKATAEAAEKERAEEQKLSEDNQGLATRLGHAVLGLQIAVAVASVGLVTKKKSLWHTSLFIAAVATVWMVWSLVVNVPPR
jgi:hypothetical protein